MVTIRNLHLLVPLITCLLPVTAAEADLMLFDTHIHYSADVWEAIPPARAMALLAQAGIERAIVSATPAEGAERLYHAAPEHVVPFLRPYPTPSHRDRWFRDPAIPGYVREHLDRIPYRGLGEIHVFGDNARTETARAVFAIARQHRLAVLAHTDLEGIVYILEQLPDPVVIWAHAGFDVPLVRLQQLLDTRSNLYLELSYREGMLEDDRLTPAWWHFLVANATRCLVGTDTYTPSRWAEIVDLAGETRAWLDQLPPDMASMIAYENARRLFSPIAGEQGLR